MKRIGAILGGITLIMLVTGCQSPLASDSNEDGTQYSVTYDANGADSGTAPEDQTKVEGTDLTLATNSGNLTRDGYTFAGWNTAADGSGTRYSGGSTYTDDADLTLYAEWTELSTYTVSYEANDATQGTPPEDQTKVEGTDLTLATNSGGLAKSGLNFAGWNTEADGSGTRYSEGSTYTDDADLTLYAEWTELSTYTVSYDSNEATVGTAPGNQTKVEGTDLTLATNSGELKRTEYIFDGWNTEPDGSGTPYAAGADYSGDGDVTLYAEWRHIGRDPQIVDVTFEGPETIDTSSGDQVVSFTVTAEDDIQLDDAYVRVEGPSGIGRSDYAYVTNSDDYSGTATSGTFTLDITIPQSSEAGTWTLYSVEVDDNLGQEKDLRSSDLATAGWDYTFENQP